MKFHLPALLLPLLASAAPSAAPSAHTKRAYSIRGFTSTANFYRPIGSWGEENLRSYDCTELFIPWPLRSHSTYQRPAYVKLCTIQDPRRDSTGYCVSTEEVLRTGKNNCPTSVEGFVKRMASNSQNWAYGAPIGRDEALRGLERLMPGALSGSSSAGGASSSGGGGKAPGPTQAGTAGDCTRWVVVKGGDSCWSVANRGGVDLARFYQLNREVNQARECDQLWVGYAYCVAV